MSNFKKLVLLMVPLVMLALLALPGWEGGPICAPDAAAQDDPCADPKATVAAQSTEIADLQATIATYEAKAAAALYTKDIIGTWKPLDAEQPATISFKADGTISIGTGDDQELMRQGTYRFIDENTLELKWDEEETVYVLNIDELTAELLVITEEGDSEPTNFIRIEEGVEKEEDDLEAEETTADPASITGTWAIEIDEGTIAYFAFNTEGQAAVLNPDGEREIGTYRVEGDRIILKWHNQERENAAIIKEATTDTLVLADESAPDDPITLTRAEDKPEMFEPIEEEGTPTPAAVTPAESPAVTVELSSEDPEMPTEAISTATPTPSE
jgi:hypothetical protein